MSGSGRRRFGGARSNRRAARRRRKPGWQEMRSERTRAPADRQAQPPSSLWQLRERRGLVRVSRRYCVRGVTVGSGTGESAVGTTVGSGDGSAVCSGAGEVGDGVGWVVARANERNTIVTSVEESTLSPDVASDTLESVRIACPTNR